MADDDDDNDEQDSKTDKRKGRFESEYDEAIYGSESEEDSDISDDEVLGRAAAKGQRAKSGGRQWETIKADRAPSLSSPRHARAVGTYAQCVSLGSLVVVPALVLTVVPAAVAARPIPAAAWVRSRPVTSTAIKQRTTSPLFFFSPSITPVRPPCPASAAAVHRILLTALYPRLYLLLLRTHPLSPAAPPSTTRAGRDRSGMFDQSPVPHSARRGQRLRHETPTTPRRRHSRPCALTRGAPRMTSRARAPQSQSAVPWSVDRGT